jgi:hypothetical protein
MRWARRPIHFGPFVALALLVASLLAGPAAPRDATYVAFVAAGGTAADLCGGAAGHAPETCAHCEGCRLASPAVPPGPGGDFQRGQHEWVSQQALNAPAVFHSSPRDRSRNPRAPPDA